MPVSISLLASRSGRPAKCIGRYYKRDCTCKLHVTACIQHIQHDLLSESQFLIICTAGSLGQQDFSQVN